MQSALATPTRFHTFRVHEQTLHVLVGTRFTDSVAVQRDEGDGASSEEGKEIYDQVELSRPTQRLLPKSKLPDQSFPEEFDALPNSEIGLFDKGGYRIVRLHGRKVGHNRESLLPSFSEIFISFGMINNRVVPK